MKRVLTVRAFALEIGPMLAAAIISGQAPRFGAVAFILAGSMTLVLVALCIRDGVVLASHSGVLDFRRKAPFMFWSGICVHVFVAAFCFFAAGIIIFRKT